MSDDRLRCHLLGPTSLTDAAGETVDSVLSSPKRLALLTYLCAASGLVGRDSLLGLLWPDEDQEHARNALNQLLHRLRRNLGRDVLTSRGSELIGVDVERVWCDLGAFETAIEEDRLADAVGMYRGELLQGFYLSGAPGFERWLENRRETTRRTAVTACRELASTAAEEAPAKAAHWLRRALEIAPNREVLLRELLIQLDASGDRAGAVEAYADFSDRLERDLSTSPSPETAALLEEITSRELARGVAHIRPIAIDEEYGDRPAGPDAATAGGEPAPVEETTQISSEEEGAFDVLDRLRPFVVPTTGLAALTLLALIGLALGRGPREARSTGELSDDVVLVTPFETAGSGIDYLSEGIVELLSIRLDGDGGPRAVDSRAALGAWAREGDPNDWSGEMIRRLASLTGAGRIVKGRARAGSGHLLLSAELLDARSGATLSTADALAVSTGGEGSAEGVLEAVETLTSRLLAGEVDGGTMLFAGDAPSLEVLKEYSAGRAAYRRGELTEAVERYRRALDRDSTFAYAALGLLEVGQWPVAQVQGANREGRRLARAYADRLDRRNRAYMEALSGISFPAPSPPPEAERAWNALSSMLPDRPEVRFQVGDHFLHLRPGYDPPLSRDVAWEKASAEFRRALALDRSFSVALDHLFQIALASGDLEEATRLAERYELEFPDGHAAASMEWALARLAGDTATLEDFWSQRPELSAEVLTNVFLWSHYIGVPLDDALLVVDEGIRRGSGRARHFRYFALLNAGRPGAALASLRTTTDVDPGREPITAALYSVGDSDAAAVHARRVGDEQDDRLSDDPVILARQAHGTCALTQWRLWHGDRSGLHEALQRIRAAAAKEIELQGRQRVGQCSYLLEALDAVLRGLPDARERLAFADSVFGRSPGGAHSHYAELLLSRLHERMGNREAALNSVRRRCWYCLAGVWYLADFLRAEGRLAAALGDHEGAIDAYNRYLAMRGDPEPAVQSQVDSVRSELSRLSSPATERQFTSTRGDDTT